MLTDYPTIIAHSEIYLGYIDGWQFTEYMSMFLGNYIPGNI